jgi:hypothetical protein
VRLLLHGTRIEKTDQTKIAAQDEPHAAWSKSQQNRACKKDLSRARVFPPYEFVSWFSKT